MSGGADKEQIKEIMRGLSLITQIGLMMVGSILVGFFLGYWLADTLGAIVGLIIGVAAGFLNCYRTLMSRAGLRNPSEEIQEDFRDNSEDTQGKK